MNFLVDFQGELTSLGFMQLVAFCQQKRYKQLSLVVVSLNFSLAHHS